MELSIVVPIYNEEENIRALHESVAAALNNSGLDYELILVDDGSTDGSFPLLKEIAGLDPRVKVIRFRRNFGQTAAMTAGFDAASGRIVVPMDGDLQNDPNDIPRLLEKIHEGNDVVSGWRKDRMDAYLNRKLPSVLANFLISRMTGVKLHDYGCTLKAYRREVLDGINLYGEMHRFVPALASQVGARVAEIPVNHRHRLHGKSKYGISRTMRVILDLMTVKFLLSYSTKPIQLFGKLGGLYPFCLFAERWNYAVHEDLRTYQHEPQPAFHPHHFSPLYGGPVHRIGFAGRTECQNLLRSPGQTDLRGKGKDQSWLSQASKC